MEIRDTIAWREAGHPEFMLTTHISKVKCPVGRENNGKDGEDNLQEGKLEGAKFEQEERAPGVGTKSSR